MSIYSKFILLLDVKEVDVLKVEGLIPGVKCFETIDDYYDLLNDFTNSMKTYFNSVVDHVVGRLLAYYRYEEQPTQVQRAIETLEKGRATAHNAAIAQIKTLNRVCEALGKTKIYDLDIDNRSAVNAFAYEFCCEMFDIGSEHLHDFDEYLDMNRNSLAQLRDPEKYMTKFKEEHEIHKNVDVHDLER